MQANSSLAVFWTMARILSDADVMLKVQAEISTALASSGGVFSLEMLQQLPFLGYCIKVSFQFGFCCQFFSVSRPPPHRRSPCACMPTAFSCAASSKTLKSAATTCRLVSPPFRPSLMRYAALDALQVTTSLCVLSSCRTTPSCGHMQANSILVVFERARQPVQRRPL
jgi:hypothetical protein